MTRASVDGARGEDPRKTFQKSGTSIQHHFVVTAFSRAENVGEYIEVNKYLEVDKECKIVE